jgi:hypothetical protein
LFQLFVKTAHFRAANQAKTLDHLSLAWIFSRTKPSGNFPNIFSNSLAVRFTASWIGKTLYSIHNILACFLAKFCVVLELYFEGIFTAETFSLPRASTSSAATTAESTHPDNPITTLSFLISLKYSFIQYMRALKIFSISCSPFSILAQESIFFELKAFACEILDQFLKTTLDPSNTKMFFPLFWIQTLLAYIISIHWLFIASILSLFSDFPIQKGEAEIFTISSAHLSLSICTGLA